MGGPHPAMSTSSKPPRPTRRSVNLASPSGSPLDRIITLSGDQDLPRIITSVLERYLVMLHRATPRFSDRELCVIIDALGETWDPAPANVSQIPREVMTAIATDRLDAKWSIDADKLGSRLDRISFHERMALAEVTAAYWNMATPDSAPQEIIGQIKELLRPPDSRPTAKTRPRRMSADLFEQAAVTGSNPPAVPHGAVSPDTGDADKGSEDSPTGDIPAEYGNSADLSSAPDTDTGANDDADYSAISESDGDQRRTDASQDPHL